MSIRHTSDDLPDLNLLIALEALLAEGNVTRAAGRLGISQSALSHKLRRLREIFEDPLFVGGRHGMVPTAKAMTLQGRLRSGLRDLRSVYRESAGFEAEHSDREFVVATSDFAEFEIIPQVMSVFQDSAPNVRMRLREPWGGLWQALEDNEVDLYVGSLVAERSGFVRRRIGGVSISCVVRQDHPHIGDTIDLDTYLGLRHLVVSATETPSFVDEALARLGSQRNVALRIPHFLGVPYIIETSNLIATMALPVGKRIVRVFPLKLVKPPFDVAAVDVFATWHERMNHDPGHQWFRNLAIRMTSRVLGAENGEE